MVAGTTAQTVPDGQGGQDGNFRRSRGEKPKEEQLTAVAEANGVVVQGLGIEELEGARGRTSREEWGMIAKE